MSHFPNRQRHSDDETHHSQGDSHRTQTTHEHTSLYHEVHETIRRLFQHLIFVSLLTLRLYMLPLLYLSHKLAVRDDPWYLATWNTMLRPGRSLADCTQCQGNDGGFSIIDSWQNMRDSIRTPLRIFRSLYALGKAIGEDPNTIQPTPVQLLGPGTDSAIDVESVQDDPVKSATSDSTEILAVPASASEIYHAALLNGNTLDDILAAFGDNAAAPAGVHEDAAPQESPDHTRGAEDRLTGPFRRRSYRKSSAQLTTERTAEQAASMTRDTDAINGVKATLSMYGQMETTISKIEKVIPLAETAHQGAGENPGTGSSCTPNVNMRVAGDHADMCTIRRCETFERRHNYHSNASKRSLSVDRPALGTLQDRATLSSPTLASTSPTKRARLQRRVRVYNDMEGSQQV